MRRIGWIWTGLICCACTCLSLAWAERIEMVTYFSSSSDGNPHFDGLTVGTAYRNETPEEGTALIGDRLGIGTASPETLLEVVGPDNQADNVRLDPGAGGSIRLSIGPTGVPADPAGEGTVSRGEKVALWNSTGAGAHKASIGYQNNTALWLQSSGNNPNNKIVFYTSSNSTTPLERMRIDRDGRVGIGTAGPVAASALLEVRSTAGGFLPPRMTSAQRAAIASPPMGLTVFDTTLGILMFHNGDAWVGPAAAGGASSDSPIGTIEAWHKSAAGTPALPAGWVECNGQTLSDPDSPYNGQVIPNLNSAAGYSAGRYLRGYTGSGTMQEATRHPLAYAASSTLYYPRMLSVYDAPFSGSRVQDIDYPDGAASGWFGVPSGGWTYPLGNTRAYASRPVSMTVVWIMRVK